MMIYILNTLGTALWIYGWLIVARALLTWFPLTPGTVTYSIYNFLFELTEPYLAIFRRFLPTPRIGSVGIDLSAVVGLLVIFAVSRVIQTL